MRFVKFIKNNLLIIGAFIVLILLSISNVNRAFIDVPYLDGLMQVPTVEKYFNGTLIFSDISKRWGEHRLIGYTLIFLLNTVLFGLNMKMEPFVFVLVYSLIGLVLYFCFKNIFKEIFKDKFKKLIDILYLPILFIVFSLVHPPGMLMTTQFVVGTLFFVLVSKYFDRICLNSNKWLDLFLFLILIFLYIAVFSGANFGGMVLAFVLCFLFKIFFSDKKKPSFYCLISIFFTLFLFVVYFKSTRVDYDGISLFEKITVFFNKFGESFKSILSGISSTTLDVHTFEDALGGREILVLINGSVLLLIGIYSIFKYIFLKMYKFTYFPFFLMVYSLGHILSTRLGRLDGGWMQPMSEWYSFHLYFYVIGTLWILFYDFLKKYGQISKKNFKSLIWKYKFNLIIFIFILGWIFSFQIFSNLAQWHRGPYVKQWLEPKKVALLYPTDENLEYLLWTKEESLEAIRILKKYKLSVFRGENSANLVKLYGWYNDNWINKSARAIIKSGLDGVVSINVSLPKETFNKTYNNLLKMQILVNEKVIKEQIFSDGFFDEGSVDIIFEVPKNQELNLEIKLDKSFIPKDFDLGKDSRELGIIISRIEIK